MSRIIITIALTLFLVFVLSQIYIFWDKRQVAVEDYKKAQAKLQTLQDREEGIEAELEYLSHPENLEKELRSRFNYRTIGEGFIILVPPTTSTNTSTTPPTSQ